MSPPYPTVLPRIARTPTVLSLFSKKCYLMTNDNFEDVNHALKNEDWHIRYKAIKRLRNSKDKQAIELLIDSLKDEHENIRSIAIDSLIQVGLPAIQLLIDVLGTSVNRQCNAATTVLVKMNPLSVLPLIHALENCHSEGKLVQIVHILGEIKDEKAIQPLINKFDYINGIHSYAAIASALFCFLPHPLVVDFQNRMLFESNTRRRPLVLVIDDEHMMGQLLGMSLQPLAINAAVTDNGEDGFSAFSMLHPDLVLTDVLMPRMDGFTLCKQIRKISDVPIIMLTALSRPDDIVRGLELGADGYITKPFTFKELVARIHALLRIKKPRRYCNYMNGELYLDFDRNVVIFNGNNVDLTDTEYRLLCMLVANEGKILTYEYILAHIWRVKQKDRLNLLRADIRRLRKKIQDDPKKPKYIITKKGKGYLFSKGKGSLISHAEHDTSLEEDEVTSPRKQRDLLRREIESQNQNQALQESGSIPLGSLGKFVSGIVHDLHGGLGVIRHTISFILEEFDANNNESLTTDLQKIVQSAEFCEVVLRNLGALGGQTVFAPTNVNIERIVRDVFFMLERKLIDVHLVVDADPDASTVVADEGQIKQVFMNLIRNAGEAMPQGGILSVRVRKSGNLLRIEVKDSGCGINPKNKERLFHEFFTTKDRGYGLGLYIVKSIIENHCGTVKVDSEIGQGTTFTLELPIK
jgi:DNA-binding response OmpR family regulator/nitrogen-specific signal transduction histidine kinase